jgi:ribosome-associated toxin RatA of RatAB toxin-antitoxin module
MENKLILVHHNDPFTPEEIENETQCMFKLLTLVHSYHNFLTAYERMDVKKRKHITNPKDSMKLYYALVPPAFQFIIGKN